MRKQAKTETPHSPMVVPGVYGKGEARVSVVTDSPEQQERAKCY